MVLRRVALLAVSANVLAACGGDSNDAQRATDRLNGSTSSILLRETIEKGGGVSFCRISQQPERPDHLLLTAVMKNDGWFQATIDPDEPLRAEDVTIGGSFTEHVGAANEADLRENGTPCAVSPADGAVTLTES